jgi:hypothetical protein
VLGLSLAASAGAGAEPPSSGAATLPRGLLIATSRFTKGEGVPPKSELVALRFEAGAWRARTLPDPASNVLHKALVWPGLGVVTLGGMRAEIAIWKPGPDGLARTGTLWSARFGGRWDRMRDAELADLDGTGELALAVATHDQGVVAIVRRRGESAAIEELDRAPSTWVHEIEVGDLDGDGRLEIYATPSQPNQLGGRSQRGAIVRYAPGPSGERERSVFVELGERHAKEILIADVDGDGRDELYAAVEPVTGNGVEIVRWEGGRAALDGTTIASLPDAMCRFLAAGDVDGDGRRELAIAPRDSGVWLARPGPDPRRRWPLALVDRDSASFEHAALFADLDGDGADELYVANDRARELRRYRWRGGAPEREVLYRTPGASSVLTWNLETAPIELLR